MHCGSGLVHRWYVSIIDYIVCICIPSIQGERYCTASILGAQTV